MCSWWQPSASYGSVATVLRPAAIGQSWKGATARLDWSEVDGIHTLGVSLQHS